MATGADSTKALGQSVRSMTAAVRNMGLAMTVGSAIAGGAMVALSQKAERVASAFREVDTITTEGQDAQAKYGDLVSELNTTMGLQADRLEVIEGLYQSVSAGVDESVESQREFLTTASELAVAGRVELGTAVDVLSTVLNTYGKNVEAADSVSTSLFQTVQFGKVRMDELAPVLGRVAALGSNLSVEFDAISASMAVLTRTGFGARVAATGLRNIFRAMLKPSDAMKEVLFEIAADQDFFAEQISGSTQRLRDLSEQYRNVSDAAEAYAQKQAEAQAMQESSSTAIQEARLKIQAIEEDRMDQLPELTSEQVEQADTVEELNQVIEEHQFKVSKARVQQEKFRKKNEEAKEQMESLRGEIVDALGTTGDLEGGIGQLILENQEFVKTLTEMKKRVDESDKSMSDIFPRTRALQGALALVGEEGKALREVFDKIQGGNIDDARDEFESLDEQAKKNFDSFEDFRRSTKQLNETDISEIYNKAVGPQQQMRNSISRLEEAITDLGDVFKDEVIDRVSTMAKNVNDVVERLSNLSDSVQGSIANFLILAVSIGAVLGPMLFFGGQMALIASAVGTGVLPVLGALAGVLGLLVHGFTSAKEESREVRAGLEGVKKQTAGIIGAAEDGEQPNSMLVSMRKALSKLVSIAKIVFQVFSSALGPALKDLGEALQTLFISLQDAFDGFLASGGDGREMLEGLARAMAEVITTFATFIENNSDQIASVLRNLADVLVNRVIPNLADFLHGIIAVLQEVDWRKFIPIAKMILGVAVVVAEVLGIIGRWMQRNDELLGQLATLAFMAGIIVYTLAKLYGAALPLISAASTLISVITGLKAAFVWLGGSSAILYFLYSIAVLVFKGIAALVGALLSPLGLLLAVITLIAVAWIKDWANVRDFISALIDFLIKRVKLMFALWTLVPRLLIAAWQDGLSGVKRVLKDFLGSWKEFIFGAGKTLMEELAKGIVEGNKFVIDALKGAVEKASNFLPSSPAEEGPFSGSGAPKARGKTTMEDFASGIESANIDVGSAMEGGVSTDEMNIGTDMQPSNQQSQLGPSSGMGAGGGKTINIDEKAIYFESGAFEGVADEEIPEMVREELDDSLDRIIEDLEATGQEDDPRRRGAGKIA